MHALTSPFLVTGNGVAVARICCERHKTLRRKTYCGRIHIPPSLLCLPIPHKLKVISPKQLVHCVFTIWYQESYQLLTLALQNPQTQLRWLSVRSDP